MPSVDSLAVAASTVLATTPKLRFTDSNGAPLVGGLLSTYSAGTLTPLATYDASGAANTNPVTLDANGEAVVRLAQGPYRFVLTDADGAQILDQDNIPGTEHVVLTNPAAPQTISGEKLVSTAGFEGPVGVESQFAGSFSDLAVTASQSTMRLVNAPNFGQALTSNLQADGLTRDVPGRWGYAVGLDTIGGGFKLRAVSPAGTTKDYAPRMTFGADFTSHSNSGNTSQNVMVSRTILGGTLGPSGGFRIRAVILGVTQGAVATVVSVLANGASAGAIATLPSQTGIYEVEFIFANRGATNFNLCHVHGTYYGPSTTPQPLTASHFQLAIDTTQDLTIQLAFTNGSATDNIQVDMFDGELITTFAV